jgi:hypothetical protein
VTDSYSKVADDVDYRKEVTEAIGVGLTVPAAMVPKVPKKKAAGKPNSCSLSLLHCAD